MEEKEIIRGYKGFDKKLKCRDFQYEIGKEYFTDKAVACETGFHFCENPFDVLNYYSPCDDTGTLNRFCEVEGSGDFDKSESYKTCCTHLKIKAEIGLQGLIKAGVKFILDRVKWEDNKQSNTGDRSAATNTGNWSAATNTGYFSAATNTGDRSAATNTGNCSAATNTGDCSAATNTGDCSAATNTGNCSAATNTGYFSAATNTGYCSAATNTGNRSAATNTGDCSAATNTGDWSAATNSSDQHGKLLRCDQHGLLFRSDQHGRPFRSDQHGRLVRCLCQRQGVYRNRDRQEQQGERCARMLACTYGT